MTTQKVYTKDQGTGEGEVLEIEGGFRVPSFADPAKVYVVRPETGGCDCPAHVFAGRRCKHVELAKAVIACRRSSQRSFGSKIAEARIVELAHKAYAPVRSGECFVASYELLLEVLASKHATEGMVRHVLKRHGRVLLLAERRAA